MGTLKCELCGRTWGLIGITIKAGTGEEVAACGPCHEKESRKIAEKVKAQARAGKGA